MSFLADTGYGSRQEIKSAVLKMTQSLRKAKGEQLEVDEKIDPSSSEKYPLLNIPDNMLTPEQLKEKQKQAFLKTASDGRQSAKQKRFEEELQRERQNQLDEEKRLYVNMNLQISLDLDLACCMLIFGEFFNCIPMQASIWHCFWFYTPLSGPLFP